MNRHKGTGTLTSRGTWKFRRTSKVRGRVVGLAVAIVESILGYCLPDGVQVHHVDGDSSNNSNENLVVCPNQAYHHLLHRRTKALEECGNANWRKCNICKKYDDPKNLQIRADGHTPRHSSCRNRLYREKQL